MIEITRIIWEAVLGVGTALTLTVIVAIAFGLAALAIFYVSSAVVVLERFARTGPRPLWVLLFAVLVAGVVGYLQLAAHVDQRAPAAGGDVWIFAGSAVSTAICVCLCWALLRWVSSAHIGTATLLILGLATALLLGGTGAAAIAAVPSVAAALVALVLWLRRRSSRQPASHRKRGLAESQLWLLASVLALGPILAVLLPEPDFRISAVGSALMQGVAMLILLGLVPLAAAGLLEMRRSAEWFIAIRYLVAQRRQVYISVITLLCVGGIAAGVWLIVTVLSVMNGFERAWREQIVGDLAHFTVHSGLGRIEDYPGVLEMVRATPGVEAASPYLDAEGMVRTEAGRLFGVRLRGVDPESAGEVTDISSRIENGSLGLLAEKRAEGGARRVSPIIIGSPLAEKLEVDVGAELVLISPIGGPPTPLGPAPRLKKFRVAGIYQSRLHQFGEVYTYVALADAQGFVRAGNAIDGIEARTSDLYTSRRVADAVRAKLDSPYYTRDWKDHFPVFFAALRDNRSMMILLLGMIMVVAAFMIVATLMMMIMEKSSDIAILKAMGAEDVTIERVFAIQGALIGLSGTSLGVVAALAVTARLEWIQTTIESVTGIDTLPASIYQLSTLPADHDPVQLIGIVVMAMVLSLGATLVPARQGAHFDAVEGLRGE